MPLTIRSAVPSVIRDDRRSTTSTPARRAAIPFSVRPGDARSVPARSAVRRSSSVSMPRRSQSRRTVFGPTPEHRQELGEGGRHLAVQALEEAQAAGRGQLRDLVGDRGADARDRRRLAVAVGARDLVRAVGNGVRGAMVGDRLEDDLARDLEEGADLVEDGRQLGVRGERGRVGGGGPRRVARVVRGADAGGRRCGRVDAGLLGHRAEYRTQRRRSGHLDPVPPEPLGAVEGPVGRHDEVWHVVGGSLAHGGTDRHGDLLDAHRRAGRAAPRPPGSARPPRGRWPGWGSAAGRRTPRRRSAPGRRRPGPPRRSSARRPAARRRRRHGRGGR